MSASDFNIRHIAHLARLRLTDEEISTYSSQIEKIISYVEKLGELPVDGIEPTSHAMPRFDILRPDAARPGLSVEEALANAPERAGDQFLVSKVVD